MSGITVLVLLLALQLPIGTVRGLVADGATGAPLGRVLVSVEGTDVSTQTGDDGRFELRVPFGTRPPLRFGGRLRAPAP